MMPIPPRMVTDFAESIATKTLDDIPIAAKRHTDFQVPEQPPEFDSDAVNLIGCDNCGRKFNEKAHAKHIKICSKINSKPREQYNAKANRIVDSEQETL